MGYSALRRVREMNRERYEIPYPCDPQDFRERKSLGEMEKGCLTFLRDFCEDLRFDEAKKELLDSSGNSIGENIIPYNMEMDIDRLCLENAVRRFMSSGTAQDAFDIYFCFLEMYLGNYAEVRKMIEMLAEFESNASSLLMKHRDHYSHSAYVFILGTALYAGSAGYRAAYQNFCGLTDERAAAHSFLYQWGFASLFHDIGYPFELPFEQVKSYFGDRIQGVPFVSYRGVESYLEMSEDEKTHFETILGMELPRKENDGTVLPADLNSVLAAYLTRVFPQVPVRSALDIISRKPGEPDQYAGYMDHAYFSAMVLFRQLREVLGEGRIGTAELDIFLAIMLHNSIYKRTLQKDPFRLPALSAQTHPLTYMLMLCDELQCWDRISYGRESRSQIHPMWCEMTVEDETISVIYQYDQRMQDRVDKGRTMEEALLAGEAWGELVDRKKKKPGVEGTYPKMVSADGKWLFFENGEKKSAFVRDIEKLLVINQPGALSLELGVEYAKYTRTTRTFLSNSSFLHLYHFAVALNARYHGGDVDQLSEAEMEEAFNRLSLEYKISNVQQAKAFGRYLDAIGCFYTDKPVAYEMMEAFSEANMDVIGPMEHERWVKEKESMGWTEGSAYTGHADSKRLRELTRTHALMIDDYDELEEEEKNKDTEPMNCMLKLIEKYDGLRIYRI